MARHPKERPSTLNGLDRRDFLRGGLTAAASLPLASALLAACQSPNGSSDGGGAESIPIARPDQPVTLPLNDGNEAIASGLPIEEGATLSIYNWDQYINKKVLDDFAKKYNCKVEVSTFNNMDEALAKIRGGQTSFDVFFPTIDILGKMAVANLMQPLNHDYLPNLQKNIWPEFSAPEKPFYDTGSRYTVPYTVYSTGIAWRNDLVAKGDWPSSRDNPYDAMWDGKYNGKIGVYDDMREAMAMSLLHNGVTDVNTSDPAEIEAAGAGLADLVSKVDPAFTTNGAYEDLPKGTFVMHQAWSGDIIAAPYYGKENAAATAPLLSYWWPKDRRGVCGNDTMCVMKDAKSPVLAHTFLNYLMEFDPAMKNFGWVGYQPPQNDAPPEVFKDPDFKWSWVVYPNLLNCIVEKEAFDPGVGLQLCELEPDVDELWRTQWDRITAG